MDDDADQLRDRVEKLEQIAASQQETIEELRDSSLLGQWGRRGVLGSIAAVLGLASASGSAAAGEGNVGTPSRRMDVFGDQGDFNTLEANKADTRSGYVDVADSRSFNTTETNNTGSDLDVIVTVRSTADGTSVGLDLIQDGSIIGQPRTILDNKKQTTASFTVPAGSSYSVGAFDDTADFTLRRWYEQQ